MSLLISLSSGKRVFYVCPQRDIARSTYNNLLILLYGTSETKTSVELDNLGLKDISIQLYYGGAVQSPVGSEAFSSQLVVLTIDAFLSPSHKFNRFDYAELYLADMVFDEYHLLMSTPAILALFSRVMLIRNLFTHCHSIFISATPEQLHWLWNRYIPSGGSVDYAKTQVLPAEFSHYPAAYQDNRYHLHYQMEEGPRFTPLEGVQYYNTVRDVRADTTADIHGHGDALEFHKRLNFEELQKRFGKQSKEREYRAALCHWGAYGFDISFRSVGTSIAPLHVFIQRIGRAIRFTGGQECDITVYEIPNRNLSERAIWQRLWGDQEESSQKGHFKNFRDMITEYYKEFFLTCPETDLDGLYQSYDAFNKNYSEYFQTRLLATLNIGLSQIVNHSPKRYFVNGIAGVPEEQDELEIIETQESIVEDESAQLASSKSNLRNLGLTYYLLTKHVDSTKKTREWILRQVDEEYVWLHFHTNGYKSDMRGSNPKFFSEYVKRMKGIKLGESVLKRYPRLRRLEGKYFQFNLQQAVQRALSPDSPLIDQVFEYHVKNYKAEETAYEFLDLGEGLIKTWS